MDKIVIIPRRRGHATMPVGRPFHYEYGRHRVWRPTIVCAEVCQRIRSGSLSVGGAVDTSYQRLYPLYFDDQKRKYRGGSSIPRQVPRSTRWCLYMEDLRFLSVETRKEECKMGKPCFLKCRAAFLRCSSEFQMCLRYCEFCAAPRRCVVYLQ